MRYRESISVSAKPDAVMDVLSDLDALAAWNPALTTLREGGRAVVGRSYHTRIRGVVPARIEFTRIRRDQVRYRMATSGAEEVGTWLLEPDSSGGTRVTHEFAHSGLLLSIMAPAFADVASQRVTRLASEVRARQTARTITDAAGTN